MLSRNSRAKVIGCIFLRKSFLIAFHKENLLFQFFITHHINNTE